MKTQQLILVRALPFDNSKVQDAEGILAQLKVFFPPSSRGVIIFHSEDEAGRITAKLLKKKLRPLGYVADLQESKILGKENAGHGVTSYEFEGEQVILVGSHAACQVLTNFFKLPSLERGQMCSIPIPVLS